MELKNLNNFFGSDLWQIREKELPYYKVLFFRFCKIIYIIGNSPFLKDIINHAMALSFQVVFSLIPLLALVFSVAKGFGIADKVEPLMLKHTVGGEIAGNLIPKIVEYVNNTNVAALGYTGLVFIIYVAISMISQVEASFNKICSVNKPRTIFRKFSDYLSVLLLAPVLLFLSLGLSTTLSSHIFIQKLLEIGLLAGAMKLFIFSLPWLTSILILTGLYLFIPNTRIRLFPALTAGFFAGIAWQLSQIIFIHFQVGVARYNAIYGTFASIPIFLAWLYTSWVIVLLGAEISFAIQNHETYHLETVRASPRTFTLLTTLVAAAAARRLREGRPFSPGGFAHQHRVPVRLVNGAVAFLASRGWLAELAEQPGTYVLSRDISACSVSELSREIYRDGADAVELGIRNIPPPLETIMARIEECLSATGRDVTLGELAAALGETPGDHPAPGPEV